MSEIWTVREVLKITLFSGALFISFILLSYFLPVRLMFKSAIVNFGLFASLTFVIFLYLKRNNISFSEFGLGEISFKLAFWGILTALLVTFIASAVSNEWAKLINLSSETDLITKELITGNFLIDYLYIKIFVGTLVPFSEEIFFRGVIFRFLRQNHKFFFSALISTIIFSVAHFSIPMIPFTLILGFTCAYAFERTKSLISPIIIHAGVNLLASNLLIFSNYL